MSINKVIDGEIFSNFLTYNVFTKQNSLKNKLLFASSSKSLSIDSPEAFNIDGMTVERTNKNQKKKADKNTKIKATAKDFELLKKRNADFNKNDPNAAAQFVDGKEVEVSPSLEDKSYEHPDTIKITDTTNGHRIVYWYQRLIPEYRDGKHFAKAEKNMPMNQEQFKDGKEYYILIMAINKDTNERIDNLDHLEIYELNYEYDEESDTSTYNLVQKEGMDGSGKSSIDYNKK